MSDLGECQGLAVEGTHRQVQAGEMQGKSKAGSGHRSQVQCKREAGMR